jgi:hypothetical protein
MEALLEPQSRRANLLLHCGAHAVDRKIIGETPTPKPTTTWTPLPHMSLIDEVEQVLKSNRLSVVNQAHSLTRDGLRYFGLNEIQNSVIHQDYAWVLGLRNSHDKTFPAGIVAGANVFVCDNLSFSGEIKIARKHTRSKRNSRGSLQSQDRLPNGALSWCRSCQLHPERPRRRESRLSGAC